jgi:hypothetical protein
MDDSADDAPTHAPAAGPGPSGDPDGLPRTGDDAHDTDRDGSEPNGQHRNGPPGAMDDGSADPGDVERDATALDDSDRRHAWVVVASLVVVGLMVAGATAASRVQEQQTAAAVADARTRDAAAVVAREAVEELAAAVPAAQGLAGLTDDLVAVLAEHVVVSERSDLQLDVARDAGEAELRRLAGDLERMVARGGPLPDAALPAEPADELFRALAALRTDAGTLSAEAADLADRVDVWGDAVRAVTAALARHVEAAAAQPATDDPDELVAAWESERVPLEDLTTVARAAGAVPGLEAWASAHLAYAQGSLVWIDEAVALLADDDLDAYNTRLEQEFGVDDPFGFSAEVGAATLTTLDAPLLADLAAASDRARRVLVEADAAIVALRELGDAVSSFTFTG